MATEDPPTHIVCLHRPWYAAGNGVVGESQRMWRHTSHVLCKQKTQIELQVNETNKNHKLFGKVPLQ